MAEVIFSPGPVMARSDIPKCPKYVRWIWLCDACGRIHEEWREADERTSPSNPQPTSIQTPKEEKL